MMFTPLLILWSKPRPRPRIFSEAGLLVCGALTVGALLFGPLLPAGYPIAYLSMPPLLWAACRFGPRESAAVATGFGAIALAGTLHGYGPFGRFPPNHALLLLQGFMGTVISLTLTVAAVVAERQRVQDELNAANATLEQRVAARTAELVAANKDLQELIQLRLRVESELELARDTALQSSRVKAQFLSNMSHEVLSFLSATTC
jgi:signal transduction histidine kinase